MEPRNRSRIRLARTPIGKVDNSSSSYDAMPAIYDFEYPECVEDELDFWDAMLQEYGGPGLELAVGTGRVAIPLAGCGHTVYGIDISQPMLDRAMSKRSKLPSTTRSRLHFSRRDIRSFSFDLRFGVIYAPFNSLLLLTSERDFTDCMSAVARHLKDRGVFVIEAFAMNEDDTIADSETLTYLDNEPESGAAVTRRKDYSFDPKTKCALSELSFTLEHPNGVEEEIQFHYVLQLYEADELFARLRKHGFDIKQVYGNLRRDKYASNSQSLIIICGRSDFIDGATLT